MPVVAILCTGLATRFLGEKLFPQGQLCVGHVVRHGAQDRVVTVINGLEAVVYQTGASAIMPR